MLLGNCINYDFIVDAPSMVAKETITAPCCVSNQKTVARHFKTQNTIQGVFSLGHPLKSLSMENLGQVRLGVSDTPNLA